MNWTPQEILHLLNQRGLTQSELARRIGVSRFAVCNWVTGRRTPCGLAQRELNRLAAKKVRERK